MSASLGARPFFPGRKEKVDLELDAMQDGTAVPR